MKNNPEELVVRPFNTSGRLAQISTVELRAELARGLSLTADTLMRLGTIWAELERRGEDLSELRHGLARTLPLIAGGRLAAEAVVAFAGRPALLRALEGVPLDRQRSLANGEAIEVIDPNTARGVLSMPLAQMPAAAVRLVFGEDGEVRTPQAQRLALRPRQQRRREDEPDRHYRPYHNPEAGTVTVGKMTIRVSDLLAELAASAGPELPMLVHKEEYVVLKVKLAPTEQAKLTEAARRAELPDWELVRKALRVFGLI